MSAVKVMSFNTQHCLNYREQEIDFQIMADAILSCGADVIGLNEVRDKGPDTAEYDKQVEYLSDLTGIPYRYFGKAIDTDGGPYGNAFLSKIPYSFWKYSHASSESKSIQVKSIVGSTWSQSPTNDSAILYP